MPHISIDDTNSVRQTLEQNFVGKGHITNKTNSIIELFFSKDKAHIVNSGSSAIFLALKVLNIKKDDEVIISAFGCPSLINQVINVGAKPIIIDSLPGSFFVDVEQLKQSISNKTKAILFHHPFGYFDNGILDILHFNIPIIEDVTQSIGATVDGKMAGTFGEFVVSSFGSTKFITAGIGGVIATNSYYSNKISKILDYDYLFFDPDNSQPERYNFSLGDFNSSLLISQFSKLHLLINRRKEIALKYNSGIINPLFDELIVGAVYFRYFLNINPCYSREIIKAFTEEKIGCVLGGIKLISSVMEISNVRKRNAENFHNSILSIPIYPSLTDDHINKIISISNSIIVKYK